MIRPILAAVLAGVLAIAAPASAARAGCDLSRVVGYTLVLSKVVDSYIEDGKRVKGFTGCNLDRVLVFTDDTAVRCKETDVQQASLPRAYLFARGPNDMKLCVGEDIYDVAQAQ